ncbi:tetraacyldisaccharide 4'-kinase [Marilutibacter chinensis]|uniref:Tetraacyldisaccharide 4'-kinase n=1 Tax=Marilutibacter chinensis TaxID=2912247 RepID=A0ABS9HPM8_9GAMM|nr:tetraacyldisaccharide 4'-kinase [Lysobacter chinensis]MCF7220583.1 tetraacyldisaccharide 4'-kinase [Lysobacter chinensis]
MSAKPSRATGQMPRYWYEQAPVPLHARLLAGLYGGVVALRRRLYRDGRRSRHPGVPVVVVGNITVGGSGKTPLTIALVDRLREQGFTPGVASRGYGRDDAGQARWVDADTDPELGGDEPVLIAARTGAKVRVDRDRVAAARALVEAGCDIVICDDGLQHYRLARDIEIEVIDGRRRYGNGRLLPAGPLREPVERGAGCDFRVLNLGEDREAGGGAGFGEWPMRLRCGEAIPLLGGRPRPLSAFAGQRVHAVAGIGDPERFFAMLRGLGIAVVPHAFPDHHAYSEADFEFGSRLPVLMTEKDAVKCTAFRTGLHFSVPVSAELPEGFWVALLDRIGARGGHSCGNEERIR